MDRAGGKRLNQWYEFDSWYPIPSCVIPAKAGTQSNQSPVCRPWTPAFAGATKDAQWEPSVWFIPLGAATTRILPMFGDFGAWAREFHV
jgi:hypothetical protein